MKDRLKRRVTGENGSSGPVGYVRYVGFRDRSKDGKPWETTKLGRRQLSGPSGHQYAFRQKGRANNPNSQWLPVRDSRDFEAFASDEADDFETRREEP